uniref:Ovule protein n=1 Tax=Strongyloides papillosus TaxID=174720 RepID=A0A0N5BBD0_STREA
MEKMMEDSCSKSEDCQRVRKAEDTLEVDQPKTKRTKSEDDYNHEDPPKATVNYIKHKNNGSEFQIPIKVNENECTIVQLGKHRYQKSSTEQIAAIYHQLDEKRRVKL